MSTRTQASSTRARVLAIDPGYDRCGIAVVERIGGKDTLLYSTCVTTDKKNSFPERLAKIGDAILTLLVEYKPDALSLEQLYFSKNQKTAMHVAEVRGAIMFLAASHRVLVFEYTPPQVKAAVAGWGRADKKQLMAILPRLISIKKTIKYDDEYDAIALGLTHLASTARRLRFG